MEMTDEIGFGMVTRDDMSTMQKALKFSICVSSPNCLDLHGS